MYARMNTDVDDVLCQEPWQLTVVICCIYATQRCIIRLVWHHMQASILEGLGVAVHQILGWGSLGHEILLYSI